MSGTVFLSCWLFSLRHSSTGACRLLGRDGSWCRNRDLWKSSHQLIFPGVSAASVLPPQWVTMNPCLPRRPGRSSLGSYGGTALFWVPVHVRHGVHPSRVESLFSPALGNSYTHSLLTFKARCSGGSSSWCQILRLSCGGGAYFYVGNSLCRLCVFNILLLLLFSSSLLLVWGLFLEWMSVISFLSVCCV